MPFDWTIPLYPSKSKEILKNNFYKFIPDDVSSLHPINKYGVQLSYFNIDKAKGIEELTRRIERFKNILSTKDNKLYFIYINEDYLYNKNYRCKDFNNRIFNEMLDLEKFLQEKYKITNYNILFFNFIKYEVPSDSNIIMIHLTCNKYWEWESYIPYTDISSNQSVNTGELPPYNELRLYCSKILCDIFMKTNQ